MIFLKSSKNLTTELARESRINSVNFVFGIGNFVLSSSELYWKQFVCKNVKVSKPSHFALNHNAVYILAIYMIEAIYYK